VGSRIGDQRDPIEQVGEWTTIDLHFHLGQIVPGVVLHVEDDRGLCAVEVIEELGAIVADQTGTTWICAAHQFLASLDEPSLPMQRLGVGVGIDAAIEDFVGERSRGQAESRDCGHEKERPKTRI